MKFHKTLLCALFLLFATVSTSHANNNESTYCLYSQSNYQGAKWCSSRESVKWLRFLWNKKASSITIPDGYKIVAYKSPWHLGKATILSESSPQLDHRLNNKISSFFLQKKEEQASQVCFFSQANFKGNRFCTNDTHYWLGWNWPRKIASIQIPLGQEVTLYKRWFLQGASQTYASSITHLSPRFKRFNSVEIKTGNQTQDTDSDGVIDSGDQCQNTPLGESVNPNGCSLSQIDTDDDGVNDDIDQCPNTPADSTVDETGCLLSQDTDQDGVSDALDQCPNTPLGEAVDNNGCSALQLDQDLDGIKNTIDQCPNTETDVVVNSIGCAFGQTDIDEDGIADNVDQCPSTEPNQPIDDKGCSQEQLIPSSAITIISPDVSSIVPAGQTWVHGTVDWNGEVGVAVNGNVATVNRAETPMSFRTMVDLQTGTNELNVIAINSLGQQSSVTINVGAGEPLMFSAELANDEGFIPLTTTLQISTESERKLTGIEIDFDGDDVYDVQEQANSGEYIDIEKAYEMLYEVAGSYDINLRLLDDVGKYHLLKLSAHAIDKQILITELTGKWSTMNSAITTGDVALALKGLSDETSVQYQPVFHALQDQFEKINNETSPMECEDVALEFASCGVVRTNSEGKRSFHFINYVKDSYGLWKISGM